MQGILIVSHGELARGLLSSARMIFGMEIPQLSCCNYHQGMSMKEFDAALREAYQEVDHGDGVIILADILGGVCYKRAMMLMNEKTELIVGGNLNLLLEILTKRMASEKMDMDQLIEKARGSMLNVRNHVDDFSRMVE